jgi:hypothetical protein
MHHSARAHGSTGIRWPCRGRGCVSLQATRLARWDGSQFQTGPRGRLLLFGSCLLSAPVGSAGLAWSGLVASSASASACSCFALVSRCFHPPPSHARSWILHSPFSIFPFPFCTPPSPVPRPPSDALCHPATNPARRGAPARPFLSLLPAAAHALTLSASPRLSPPITDPPRVSRLSPLASRRLHHTTPVPSAAAAPTHPKEWDSCCRCNPSTASSAAPLSARPSADCAAHPLPLAAASRRSHPLAASLIRRHAHPHPRAIGMSGPAGFAHRSGRHCHCNMGTSVCSSSPPSTLT